MIETMVDYVDKHPDSSIQLIEIVIYYDDVSALQVRIKFVGFLEHSSCANYNIKLFSSIYSICLIFIAKVLVLSFQDIMIRTSWLVPPPQDNISGYINVAICFPMYSGFVL